MNKIFLTGNLTRDPELTTAGASGISVCRFAIAVNRKFADKDGNRETDFFNITAWRGLGETCAKYVKKGSKVTVVGEVQIRNYEDKDGNKKIAIDVVADEVEFLDRKPTDNKSDKETPTVATDTVPVPTEELPL